MNINNVHELVETRALVDMYIVEFYMTEDDDCTA